MRFASTLVVLSNLIVGHDPMLLMSRRAHGPFLMDVLCGAGSVEFTGDGGGCGAVSR